MGRIKTKPIKRATNELVKEYQGRFTGDFSENKRLVAGLIQTKSKKIRNVVAGYVTRLNKAKTE
jgi:small subunit ribosomal protein S17e